MKKDLTAGTLVMCKAHESDLDGWRWQYYWQKGQTLTSMESGAIHNGWLYVVPLRYFKPTSPDWRPEEKYNWAKFGEGE
ncbi:MAG: hypothetical protein LUC16_02160 [Coprobacillus sp.]|nr:hypothetical protein [Coprobacillus sp.]